MNDAIVLRIMLRRELLQRSSVGHYRFLHAHGRAPPLREAKQNTAEIILRRSPQQWYSLASDLLKGITASRERLLQTCFAMQPDSEAMQRTS